VEVSPLHEFALCPGTAIWENLNNSWSWIDMSGWDFQMVAKSRS
jgi:hypothetical protein